MNSTLAAADGLPLHLREWPLAASRGTVLIVHGLGEHIGRYEHVAARLNEAGWSVKGYDQRGHGRSGGARGVLARPDDLLTDLGTVIAAVRADSRAPLVLLGHSMGGAVTARFVAEGSSAGTTAGRRRPVDALVLSSPALAAGLTRAQERLLGLLSWLGPNVTVNNGLKPEWVSRDAAVVRAYAADPLVHDRASAKLVRFIVESGDMLRPLAPRWTMPTLLLWAGSDRCVVPAASAAFATAAPAGVLVAREFPTLYHEIFNEPEQADVLSAVVTWLAEWSRCVTTVVQVRRPTLAASSRRSTP